ncbi:hypothetical protein AVEN_50099-1 [Araneus ventricosus]|uniref:Uncharacterized protein n=1 Tax=Araneus ventricosus TaxID=182803 RepID=A0A4Y2FRU3_ARAVE|nr:hypothetical protein AVEN_50099-1 [Araneus ventricosus]
MVDFRASRIAETCVCWRQLNESSLKLGNGGGDFRYKRYLGHLTHSQCIRHDKLSVHQGRTGCMTFQFSAKADKQSSQNDKETDSYGDYFNSLSFG